MERTQQRREVTVAVGGVFLAVGIGTPFAVYAASFNHGQPRPIDWWTPWMFAAYILGLIGATLLLSLFAGWPIHSLAPGLEEQEQATAKAEARDKKLHLAQLSQRLQARLNGPIEEQDEFLRLSMVDITEVGNWIETNYSAAELAVYNDLSDTGVVFSGDDPEVNSMRRQLEVRIGNVARILQRL